MNALLSGRVKVNSEGKLEKPVFALSELTLKNLVNSLKESGWVIKKDMFLRGPYVCCVMVFEGRK